MKRILYTFALMGVVSFTYAQRAVDFPLQDNAPSLYLLEKTPMMNLQPADEVIHSAGSGTSRDGELFFDDFTDGDANWEFFDESTPPTSGWVIGDTPPAGFFSEDMGAIASTSGGNFAMFDSDGIGTSADNVQDTWIQLAEPLDLSLEPFVAIEFESYYRAFSGDCFVQASADGEEWTTWQVHEDVAVNDPSANPELIYINISEAIGGAATAWIRFRYQGTWDYAWMVDDVALVVPPDNDILLSRASINNWEPLTFDAEVADIEAWDDFEIVSSYQYTHMFKDAPHTLNPTGVVINQGVLPQTNIIFTATIQGPSGAPETFSSEAINLEPGDGVFLTIEDVVPAGFTTGEEGLYTVTFNVTADAEDQVPDNNTVADVLFNLTDGVMANDDALDNPNWLPLTGEGRTYGMRYAFPEDVGVATHIRFALWTSAGAPTTVEEIIQPNLRAASVIQPESGSNPTSPLFGANDMAYTVEAEALNSADSGDELIFVNVPLPEPVDLLTGQVYQTEITFPLGVDPTESLVRILAGDGNNAPFAGVVFIPTNTSSWGQGWFGVGRHPVIRLVSDNSINTNSVDKLNFNLSQNYPNPSFGETTIEWELYAPAKNVRFSVTDLTGRTVFAKDLGDRPAGKQEPLILDVSGFAAGNYQYGITIGQERIVRKMVIVK